jgi:hypothetical protein
MRELSDKVRNIVFIVDGGIGKNIAATAVVKSIKTAYPTKNIIVIAGCQEVFFYNPNIKRVFNFNNPLHFYDDYVNEETVIFKEEPYLDYGYVTKQKHLIQAWCDDLEIENVQKTPDLHFLDSEFESAEMYIKELKEKKKKQKKGFILFQWVGGKFPENNTNLEYKKSLAPMFRRAIPHNIATDICAKLIKDGYIVGVVGHENFPTIENAEKIFFPIRSTLALLKYADYFIGIDSFLQHAAASDVFNTKGIVLWGGTSPNCLGYDKHVNLTRTECIEPFCHRPNSYLFDIQGHGAMWDCPYGEKCLKYSTDTILETFNNLKKTSKEKV